MASPSSPVLQKLPNLETSSPDFQAQLFNAFYQEEYVKCVRDLEGDDPTWLVNYLDRALNVLEPSGVTFRKCLRELRSICGNKGILPTSYSLPSHLLVVHPQAFAVGGCGDVYHGTFNGSGVCIKHARVYIQDGMEKVLKDFCREAVMWKRMVHPNVVPLLGITISQELQEFRLISNRMSGGELLKYISEHPGVDRLRLLCDVANGLCHLHSCSVIHGDLKGRNILVDDMGRACLADFGLSMVTRNLESIQGDSQRHGFSPRWSAPEVLRSWAHSQEADVFSFGMVMYEVFTGAVPFSGKPDTAAMFNIMNDDRPPRPEHPAIADWLWSLIECCWDSKPRSRPEMSEVLETLLNADIPAEDGLTARALVTKDRIPKAMEISSDVPQQTGPLATSPGSPALQKLHNLEMSSPEFQDQLFKAFYREEYVECVRDLGGDDPTWLVNYLDMALNVLEPSGFTFRKCLRELRSICGNRGILPTSYLLSSHLLDVHPRPFASGSFGDVYKGTFDSSSVCIKHVRFSLQDDQNRVLKEFCQEAVVWKRMVHPNIVPLLGITTSPRHQMISDWMPGEDLPEYIKKYPGSDRRGLLSDVANGLNYLHSCSVIHGDLKGSNILVDISGHARIADFGLTKLTKHLHSIESASHRHGPLLQWSAPEVLKEGAYSKEADVFSFGMVVYEVLTGSVPFSGKRSTTAAFEIMNGQRPPRLTHLIFSEELWSFLERCWAYDPHLRPNVLEAMETLLSLLPRSGIPAEAGPIVQAPTPENQTSKAVATLQATLLSSHPVLQQLRDLDKSSSEFHIQLSSVLYGDEYIRCVTNLRGDSLAWLVEFLDDALDCLATSSATFRKCLRELRSICGAKMILPASFTPSYRLTINPELSASGGCGDVRHGTLDGSKVRVKHVRMHAIDDQSKAAKTFYGVAVKWKHLKHPNIVPLLGVTITPFQLISDLMPGMDLLTSIRNRNINRLALLSDTAEGLHYLHSCNVIHGDLKGHNILVDDSGRAQITDFGLAVVAQSLNLIRSTSSHGSHAPRWTAPEVLNGGVYSKKSDIFSLAMVMIEVFTGAVPFNGMPDEAAIHEIMSGKRPPRPHNPIFTTKLWKLMQRCWNDDPYVRPRVSDVLRTLPGVDHLTWKSLTNGALSTDERIYLLTTISSDPNQVNSIRNLSGSDAQALIDDIDEVLDSLTPQVHKNCLRYLSEACGSRALLPRSMEIPLGHNLAEDPFSHSGLANVWKIRYQDQDAAVRVFKAQPGSDTEKIRRRFLREVVTWRALHHPNVLPFLGVEMAENRLAMVSEWMQRGNIKEFVAADPTVDRLGLLIGVTRGLIYMHNRGITHGDLRGGKILVDGKGHARLTGPNPVTIASEQTKIEMLLPLIDKFRWMSPEFLKSVMSNPAESRPTKESDCYSLGMVIYEVLSGQVPFSSHAPAQISEIVLRGGQPKRPQGIGGEHFTGEIWKMLECCWKEQPGDRLNAKDVLVHLRENPSLSWVSDTDGDTDTDSDKRPVVSERDPSGSSAERGSNLKEGFVGFVRRFRLFGREGSK